jgi:hypothetical protein
MNLLLSLSKFNTVFVGHDPGRAPTEILGEFVGARPGSEDLNY